MLSADRRVVTSARAGLRLAEAERWLSRPATRTLLLAANAAAAGDLFRKASLRHGGSFGWDRTTLTELPALVAAPDLAALRLAPASRLAVDAAAARAVVRLSRTGDLGRFAPIALRLGFPRAVSRTVQEVRTAGVDPSHLPADVARLVRAYEDELAAAHLADPARLLTLATARIRSGAPFPWRGVPMVWLDLAVRTPLELDLLTALAEAADGVLAVAPTHDTRTVAALRQALGVDADDLPVDETTGLGRLQARLFAETTAPGAPSDDVEIFSAPGEERECAEIVRRILRSGAPFDRIAVLLRGPTTYRLHLQEALERARIPAWWSQGTKMPDPVGRAFLALLACRAERFSARRFAEYLSLGEIPDTVELRAPRRWEQMLVEAAVIGGLDRWRRRLDGLEAELVRTAAALATDPARREQHEQRLARLRSLRGFALPLLEQLADLPESAPWSAWLPALAALAEVSLREPRRVIDVLDDLRPLGPVGPVGLREVRHVLGPHLLELPSPPPARRYGRVFVGPVHAARGLDFDLVLVAGLGERIFPPRLFEDPLLLDPHRRGLPLDTAPARHEEERLLLHLAVGASSGRVVLSWPRIELDQVRARVPSVYALDAVRAVEGRVPSFRELGHRADRAGASRIDWPAPQRPEDAVDAAEYDLAFLREVQETRGAARWLVETSPALYRSLKARWTRWHETTWPWDGLYAPDRTDVTEALAPLHPSVHPWAATALELYARCPYQLYLRGILRLAPREEPDPVEELGPLARGSILHEVAWRTLVDLRDRGWPAPDEAHGRLDTHLAEVAERWHDDLHPAVERVWTDEIARLRADLREWLRRLAEAPDWRPWRFELAFGLPPHARADVDSRPDPLPLPLGLVLRGSIDLVERRGDGALRVTDYKTGKVQAGRRDVVRGGRILQPLLYAMACEALFPGVEVEASRLWYATHAARFEEVPFRLDEDARSSVAVVVRTVGDAIRTASLPAAPATGECRRCAYRPVCGSSEERRVLRKRPDEALSRMRDLP